MPEKKEDKNVMMGLSKYNVGGPDGMTEMFLGGMGDSRGRYLLEGEGFSQWG